MSQELTIADRVSAVKAEMPTIPKDSWNPHNKYKYASVDVIYAALRPLMAKNGLDCKMTRVDKETSTDEKSKTWLHLTYHIWLEAPGLAEEPQLRDISLYLTGPQSFEAAVSYLKKQYLRGRFEVETGEPDLDAGEASTPPPSNASPRPASEPKMPPIEITVENDGFLRLPDRMTAPEGIDKKDWELHIARALFAKAQNSLRGERHYDRIKSFWDPNCEQFAHVLPENGYKILLKLKDDMLERAREE